MKPLKSNPPVVIVNAKYKTIATVSATANGRFLAEPAPRVCICDRIPILFAVGSREEEVCVEDGDELESVGCGESEGWSRLESASGTLVLSLAYSFFSEKRAGITEGVDIAKMGYYDVGDGRAGLNWCCSSYDLGNVTLDATRL